MRIVSKWVLGWLCKRGSAIWMWSLRPVSLPCSRLPHPAEGSIDSLLLTSTGISIWNVSTPTPLPSETGQPDAGNVPMWPLLTWRCGYTSPSAGGGRWTGLRHGCGDHCLLSPTRKAVLALPQSVLCSIRKERSWHDSGMSNNQTR